jgi:hypothetical protein
MAKIRSIKPNFFASGQIANCSRDARLLFIGLWVFADDAGIHPASSHTLRLEVFPGDNDMTTEKTTLCISELIKNKLIMEYEASGEIYWKITGWSKHQKITRPNYRYPPPPDKNSRHEVTQNQFLNDKKIMFAQYSSTAPTVLEHYKSDAEAMTEPCSDTPGNGNGDGNDNDNGKDICRVADAARPLSSELIFEDKANTDEVQAVFHYWQTALNHPKAVLDDKRKKVIQRALKNYSVDDLQQAIKGCSQSKFHMGENDQHKRYDDITLILSNSTRIESFMSQEQYNVNSCHTPKTTADNRIFAGAI